jgi:hypothetical protein
VWSAQVNAAKRAGVRGEAIDVIRKKGDAGNLTAEERVIITYGEQLFRKNKVERAAFDALLKRHGAQWLLELTAGASYYGILCSVVNAFEVPAPPDGDKLRS